MMVFLSSCMGPNHTNTGGENGLSRRKTLKALGTLSLVGVGSVGSVSATQTGGSVVRLSGSFDSPLSFDETRGELEKLAGRTASADSSLFADKAVPEFGEDERIVEYVARIDSKGRLSQYYGASIEEKEEVAHDNATQKEASFEAADSPITTSDVSAAATPTDPGQDWNFIQDNQANSVNHWGELNNNYEWYRIRNSSEERNAFRTRAASSDDTINPYGRQLNVEHNWGVSDLGSEDVHSADPTTSSGGTQTVSIGFPPSASLSWEFDSTGHTQNLSNSEPKVNWSNDIPTNGTTWFHPGSHIVADSAHCNGEQNVVDLTARATWGMVYESEHTWHISTVTC